jgi:molybdopterin/thiamine biosynthesis adenylyltransferase
MSRRQEATDLPSRALANLRRRPKHYSVGGGASPWWKLLGIQSRLAPAFIAGHKASQESAARGLICAEAILVFTGTAATMQLSPDEVQRYARHLALPEVGRAGQQRLRSTRVLCVGTGGLGSPVLLYLAAAGIGRLGVVDFDAVERSNLQRQIIHRTPDVGRPKTESARESLNALNPDVEVVVHNVRLTRENALAIIRPYDLVVDGTDNFPTRYLTNDACVLLQRPNIYGSIFRFEGQASVFAPHLGGPCYRCLYPEPPPPCTAPSGAESGVLGVLPGLIGTIQATEALKLALGKGSPLIGRLLLLDALEMKFKELKLRRDPKCPICGEHPTITQLIDYAQFCGDTQEASNEA